MGESSREEICAWEQTLLGLGADRFLLGPRKQGAQLRQALELRAKYCQRLPPKRSAWKEDAEQFVKSAAQELLPKVRTAGVPVAGWAGAGSHLDSIRLGS